MSNNKPRFHVRPNDSVQRGFILTFKNEWRISVQFGDFCYSDGKDLAEIAIIKPDGDFYDISEYDQVLGYQTTDDVARWVAFTASQEG